MERVQEVLELFPRFRSSHRRCSRKKVFLNISQYSQVIFIKEETLTQVFSCEYCEIFKETYFEKHLRTATSRGFTSSHLRQA